MKKKYEILKNGIIKVLRDFGDVKKGDIGGVVSSEYNLSHSGDCWIDYDSKAINRSKVMDNAKVVRSVITNCAMVEGNSKIVNSTIAGSAVVAGNSLIDSNSTIKEHATVKNSTVIHSIVRDCAIVTDGSKVVDSGLSNKTNISNSTLDHCTMAVDTLIMDDNIHNECITH